MDITGRTPVAVTWNGNVPYVELLDFGDLAFTDPFFDRTVATARAAGVAGVAGAASVLLPVPELCELFPGRGDSLTPQGFIFHMSRCGSTAISRALSASRKNLVVSEPDFILDLLNPPVRVHDDLLDQWLKTLVLLLGRPRRRTERHYLIKWQSLHTVDLPRLRRVFPATPWIFVHRDAIEVLISAMNNPKTFVLLKDSAPARAANLLDCTEQQIREMDVVEYIARVLGLYCTIADKHLRSCTLSEARQIDYRSLPSAIWTTIAPHFHLPLFPEDEQILRSASRFYSKDPTATQLYRDDSATKNAQATPTMREACEKWVTEPLERIRRTHAGL